MKTVTFENVSKTYNVGDSEVTALDHVSFSIEDKSVTVILGPSGSGKSTMLPDNSCHSCVNGKECQKKKYE